MKLLRKSISVKLVWASLGIIVAGFGGIIGLRLLALHGLPITPEYLLLIIAALFVALIAFVVIDIVLPLRRITSEMESVLAGRRYGRVEKSNRIDELDTLARFFNSVVGSIEKLSQDIRTNNRRSAELELGQEVQKKLLPKSVPTIPGLDLTVRTRPASEIGGDNFDIIQRGDQTIFYIGDATGHGFPAGLIMSMVNVLIHAAAAQTTDTKELLASVNQHLTPKILHTMFMTLVMFRWDSAAKKLFYTGCGHEHILIWRHATKSVEVVKTGGIALGMVPNIAKVIREKEISFEPNDAVVVYTDGLTEALNKQGEMLRVAGLASFVEKAGSRPDAAGMFRSISNDFANFVGPDHESADDMTLMVFRFDPDQSSQPESKKIQLKLAPSPSNANWGWEQ